MIIDNINNAKQYYALSDTFKKAFEFASTLTKDTPCGHIDICDGLYVNIMEYSGKELTTEIEGEAHKEYIDIQFILNGSEKIGYANIENLIVSVDYNKDKDIEFVKGDFEFITLNEGDFLIAFPQDGHAPGFKSDFDLTKKAVFKLRIDKA